MSMLQNSWGGDYVHVYKFEHGGGLSGGYCPTLSHCALKHFNAPHRESMRYLNGFTTHRCVARCVTGLSQAKLLLFDTQVHNFTVSAQDFFLPSVDFRYLP